MRRLLPVLSILLLAGCAQLPGAYQGTSFSQPVVALNVSNVLVDNVAESPAGGSQIDNQLQPTPADQLRAALAERYRATGKGPGTLRFTIKEASVIEVVDGTPPQDWFQRAFGKPTTYRYEGKLRVESTAESITQRRGFVQAEASRTLEISSNDGATRARYVQGMVRQMVDELLVQLDKEISGNMGGLVMPVESSSFVPQRTGRWDHVINPPKGSAGL